MAESLIEQLPKIVAESKKEAERILNQLSERERVVLQTNEYVINRKPDPTGSIGSNAMPLSRTASGMLTYKYVVSILYV